MIKFYLPILLLASISGVTFGDDGSSIHEDNHQPEITLNQKDPHKETLNAGESEDHKLLQTTPPKSGDNKEHPAESDNHKSRETFADKAAKGTSDLKQLVSEQCLDCLCQMATQCDLAKKCEDGECGMFAISFPFWEDAFDIQHPPEARKDVPVDVAQEAEYKSCTTNLVCATTSIQRYFNKYYRDCNNDGVIDCLDYTAMHTLGPFGCLEKPLPEDKADFMKSCLLNAIPGAYSEKITRANKGKPLPMKKHQI